MRIVIFCHSLVSDWNHGNAHFLRGIASELALMRHAVDIYEARDAWSAVNLALDQGSAACQRYRAFYPSLTSKRYDSERIDLERELQGADLVLVHEWNTREIIDGVAQLRKRMPFIGLFHDTHHRSVSAPGALANCDIGRYDGVLAFGRALARMYAHRGLSDKVFVWHEAADTRIFNPPPVRARNDDLVWVGNWGDEERTAELSEFLLEPVRRLRLRAFAYGVRYPEGALSALKAAGIAYRGWIPNFEVPGVFAGAALTVHIPRRPYVETLPGIPTIRVFEALACGIPLICAPWEDAEELFREGDFLIARDGDEMSFKIESLLKDPEGAARMARRGWRTVLERHTCAHRAAELLNIYSHIRHNDTIDRGNTL
jgi:spore maturation protein CgeB